MTQVKPGTGDLVAHLGCLWEEVWGGCQESHFQSGGAHGEAVEGGRPCPPPAASS